MMRQHITLLVAATTSAIIVAFVIPLCLLVRTLAEDRALVATTQIAQNLAVVVGSIADESRLASAVSALDAADGPRSSVLLPSGRVLGSSSPPMASDTRVQGALRTAAAATDRSSGDVTVVVPVAMASGLAVVRAQTPGAQTYQGVLRAWATIVGLGGGLFLLALAVGRELGRRVGTPVSELADVAHRLRRGELSLRAQPRGPEEVVELGVALNQLADRIGDLLAIERESVADLGHRLRTPVTALRLDADLARPADVRRRLHDHVDQLQHSIDSLIAEARRPVRAALTAGCEATAAVAGRVAFWRPLAEDQSRSLTVDMPAGELAVAASCDDLAQLVDNLVENVFAHTPEGVPLRVSLGRASDGPVQLSVEDGGPGLPDEAVSERGASGGGSTGLGLDIVARIAESAGGSVRLGRSSLGGLAVHVTLADARS